MNPDLFYVIKPSGGRNHMPKRIAYSGIEGAFAHVAARRLFPDEIHVSFGSFKDAYDAAVSGGCEAADLPIWNSYAGDVCFPIPAISVNVRRNIIDSCSSSPEKKRMKCSALLKTLTLMKLKNAGM